MFNMWLSKNDVSEKHSYIICMAYIKNKMVKNRKLQFQGDEFLYFILEACHVAKEGTETENNNNRT